MNSDRIEDFLNAIKPESQYNNFLKDKRIAIVGPSKHALLKQDGKSIDNYDVVIRLKWMPIENNNPFSAFIGDKTDVMYSSAINDSSDFKVLSQNGVRYSRHPVGKESVKPSFNVFENVFVRSYSSEEYSFLLKEYASQNGHCDNKIKNINSKSPDTIWPQLGLNAIMEAIASDAREVYITGFTMYHGGGHMLQKNKPAEHNKTIVEKHNGMLEILMLLDIVEHSGQNDKRIVLDSTLSMILDGYKTLNLEDASPANRKTALESKMNEMVTKVNYLIKDL